MNRRNYILPKILTCNIVLGGKKLKKLNALIIGFVVFLISSCGKDDDSAPIIKTCLLTKTKYDQFTKTYQYNTAGKISIVNIIQPNSVDSAHHELLYNAAGNLIEIRLYNSNNQLEMSDIFTYNQHNLPDTIHLYRQLLSGTTKSDGYILHQYNNTNQITKTSFFPDRQAQIPNIYADFSYPAPDQVIEKQYLKNASGNLFLESTWHYFYDNKINPLANLGFINTRPFLSNHNLIGTKVIFHNSGITSTETISYTFNADGYPVNYTISSPDFPSVSGSYEYYCFENQ